MAEAKNLCSRSDGLDNLGKSGKAWNNVYAKNVYVETALSVNGIENIDGKLAVKGSIAATNGISSSTNITASGAVTASGTVTAAKVSSTGDITANGAISTPGEVDTSKIVFTHPDSTADSPTIGEEAWTADEVETHGLVIRGGATYFNPKEGRDTAWINNETGAASFSGDVTVKGDLNVSGAVYGAGGLGSPYTLVDKADTTYIVDAVKSATGSSVTAQQYEVQNMFSDGTYTLAEIIDKVLANAVTVKMGDVKTITSNCNCCDCSGDDGI